jgi:hypothetical protein
VKPQPNTIIHGDCIEVMRTWPDAFVQCIVTSPPYWGLRDYGTATWDGGDAECDHVKNKARNDAESRALIDGSVRTGASTIQFANQCGKCGAVRIDAQLGLEKSPEEYVAKMVEEATRSNPKTSVASPGVSPSHFKPMGGTCVQTSSGTSPIRCRRA